MEKPQVTGLLLAAGAGRRFGRPKALVELDGETLVERGVRVLRDGGCTPVTVVVGAQHEAVRARLPPDVRPVHAADWREGMGASLRAGLRTVGDSTAVLVNLVDLPGVDARTVAALCTRAAPEAVVRATYDGRPGHPVLIGTAHLAELVASLGGDEGARSWLRDRPVEAVECGRFGHGGDLDTHEDGVRLGLWRAKNS